MRQFFVITLAGRTEYFTGKHHTIAVNVGEGTNSY